MNQQLLIKHCEGKFEPKEEIPQTPVEDVGKLIGLIKHGLDLTHLVFVRHAGRYEPAAVVPTPAGERLASSAQEELEQSSSTDRATLSEVPVARKAASKSQAPPSDEEDEQIYEEEETGRATGRPGQSLLVSSLAVAAAGLFTSAVYLP